MIRQLKHVSVALSVFMLIGIFGACSSQAGVSDFLQEAQKSLGVGQSQPAAGEADIAAALKQALEIGSARAVQIVSQPNGYYENPQIKIPLPSAVEKVEGIVRTAGYGSEIDALELSMNRAAERAAPEAKAIFVDTIKQMSFSDAKKILEGPDNEATLYFKEKTGAQLQQKFKPIVHDTMSEVGVTRDYQDLEAKMQSVPFAGSLSFDLDQYVTGKALDGLFFMLAQEEKKIREDPAARATDLLKKVFGNQ